MIDHIGKYRIIERVGRGGMGSVFKAHDPVLDRLVALKVVSTDTELTDEIRARFFREAQACAKLTHPNIVTIHDLGEADGNVYIVMELLEGEELRQVIAKRTIVQLEDKLALMSQICDGLEYAHDKGIVHRDVKPGNIFVLRNGQVKILDFGIAHIEAAQPGLTRTGLVVGTLQYMPPERVRGRGDHRSDIFSVGAVFYELLSLRPPFTGNDPIEILEKIRTEDAVPLEKLDPTLPRELGAIVQRALQKDPTHRFARLGQMRAELAVVQRKLAEDAERLRVTVRGHLRQLQTLREVLGTRVGGAWANETVVVVDDRATVATLEAVARDSAARIDRLRDLLSRAAALQPAFDRGVDALGCGDLDAAAAALAPVVQEMPEHVHAAEALAEAQRRLTEARRRRAELTALLQEATDAYANAAYARCLKLLEHVGELNPTDDACANVEQLRRDCERALEAVRRAREGASLALDHAEHARRDAETAESSREAPDLWTAAEARLVTARAAFDAERFGDATAAASDARNQFEQAASAARGAAAAAREATRVFVAPGVESLASGAPAATSVVAKTVAGTEPSTTGVMAAEPMTIMGVAGAETASVAVADAGHVAMVEPAATANDVGRAGTLLAADAPALELVSGTPSVDTLLHVDALLVEATPPPPPAGRTRGVAKSLGAAYRQTAPAPVLRYAAIAVLAVIVLAGVVWRFEVIRDGAAMKADVDRVHATAVAARERALTAEAGRLATDAFARAQASVIEGDRASAARQWTLATHAYADAATQYGEAERLALTVRDQRAAADRARVRMAAAKQSAAADAEEFAGAVAQERQGNAEYERLQFAEATASFQGAAELFSKALPKPKPPVVQDPRTEIRAVLNDYVRSVETKNVELLRRVRACLTDDDLQRARAANELKRSHKVELRVYELAIAGDNAQAAGRREDVVLLTNGQRYQTETTFVYTFKRGPQGWRLCELRDSDVRPAKPRGRT